MPDVPSVTSPEFIYLDNNATTALFPEVVAAMAPYWQSVYGNPSSSHYAGRCANRAMETFRKTIADTLNVKPFQLFFNSGATEGNNWIFHAFAASDNPKKKVVVSAIEHKSVLKAAQALDSAGVEVTILPIESNGTVSLDAARELIDGNTGLVSIQLANNETGVIQPVRELAELAHRAGAFFHCDAVQGLGKIPFDLYSLDIDSAVFSGHKIHGPKGTGLLYLKSGSASFPFPLPLHGGGQEQGIRPGTVNISGIAGLAKAFEMLPDEPTLARIGALRDRMETLLLAAIPGCVVHGADAPRLPNTVNVAIPFVPADILMANLPLVCISDGSACNSGAFDISYVLKAMGISSSEARRSIRISTSVLTTELEIDSFIEQLTTKHKKFETITQIDGNS